MVVKKAPGSSAPVQLGCPGCLRLIKAPEASDLACRYCGTKIPVEEGKKLATLLEGFEAKAVERLLAGEPPSQLQKELEEGGAKPDRAFAFVDRLVMDLPFHRQAVYEKDGTVARPSTCDSCGLQTDLTAFEALWQIDKENLRYRADWGGFTGEFGKMSSYDRKALYFLCKNCQKAKPETFAGGYPHNAGFARNRFSRVKALS
ncbi:MAG: hypothetical protein KC910_08365 [Candidatus Eremiobacteraeota bacterium]|nr:hypothetical protein [Candidatus Eremiobacteraeota bacterium]